MPTSNHTFSSLRHEMSSLSVWAEAVLASAFCCVLVVVFALADASLLFAGQLQPALATGVGMALVGAAACALVVALKSSSSGVLAGSQEACIVILATMLGGLAERFQASSVTADDTSGLLPTVVAALMLSTVCLGVLVWLAGYFRLGRFVRYIPFPVVAGFLAGAGLVMVKYAMILSLGEDSSALSPGSWLDGAVVLKLVLMTAVAVALIFTSQPQRSRFAVPLLLLLLLTTAISVFSLWPADGYWQQHGWTLAAVSQQIQVPALRPTDFGLIRWDLLPGIWPQFLALLIVTLIAALIKVSNLELILQTELDQDRELRAVGSANIVAGSCGGLPGFHTLTMSILVRQLRGCWRLTGVLLAVFSLLALVIAESLLTILPRFVFGGMILWVALDLIHESLIQPLRTLRRLESAIIAGIALAIITLGFLPGIVIGLLAGVLLFVVDYSRIDIIRQQYTRGELQSNVDRNTAERALLQQHQHQLLVLRLHGYLFFGTSYRFIEQLKSLAGKSQHPELQHIVLDMRKVSGLDTAATQMFSRLCLFAETNELQLVVASAPAGMQAQMQSMAVCGREAVSFVDSLDAALEWSEEQVLAAAGMVADDSPMPSLARWLFAEDEAAQHAIAPYIEPVELQQNELLFEQGELSAGAYLVVKGRLDVELEALGGERMRLRRVRPGAVLGEVSLYSGQPRTARARAITPCELQLIRHASLQQLLREQPAIAAKVHAAMAHLLADRLADSSRQMQVLLNA